jgi:hypothetical protein
MTQRSKELNLPSGYLYFMDVPEWEAEECPKCGEGISANWIQGQGYYYCGNGCELTVDNIEDNAQGLSIESPE